MKVNGDRVLNKATLVIESEAERSCRRGTLALRLTHAFVVGDATHQWDPVRGN